MPKSQKSSGKSRHDPLHVQLDEDEVYAKYGRVSQPGKRKKSRKSVGDEDEDGQVILDPKTSQRIFELARDQQEEELVDEEESDETAPDTFSKIRGTTFYDEDAEDEENLEDIEEEEVEIDADDLETLDALLPSNKGERKTLADIIFSKLEENEGQDSAAVKPQPRRSENEAPDPAFGLDPRIVEAYTKVGYLLEKYKSPPLPKMFKVIPSLPAWARILALTHPENWSPQACYAATRIFISNMKPAQAQVFLHHVLLDAIREDIQNNKKLNYHYYHALKRAFYKPAAAFKGVIFPLLENACTLKEAAIVASVLARTKIPVLHTSVAMMHIAEMDYAGANSLFLRVLIDKKYELPYRVIDALVLHFANMSSSYRPKSRGAPQKLPVLWHQSLLAFVQRYASDLTPEHKDVLLDVIRVNTHPQISPEVRRELVNSVARGEPRKDADNDVIMA